jgi:hypothetical protein
LKDEYTALCPHDGVSAVRHDVHDASFEQASDWAQHCESTHEAHFVPTYVKPHAWTEQSSAAHAVVQAVLHRQPSTAPYFASGTPA